MFVLFKLLGSAVLMRITSKDGAAAADIGDDDDVLHTYQHIFRLAVDTRQYYCIESINNL